MPHIHEKIDYTVEVFIVYKDKVLLRKHDKYGIWLSVGGHIELNEDPNEAALREVKEEVGLDIELDKALLPAISQTTKEKDLIPPYYLNRNKINEFHDHVTFIYFATSSTDTLKIPEHEKTDGIQWFSEKELKESNEVTEHIKFYALQALDKLSS